MFPLGELIDNLKPNSWFPYLLSLQTAPPLVFPALEELSIIPLLELKNLEFSSTALFLSHPTGDPVVNIIDFTSKI